MMLSCLLKVRPMMSASLMCGLFEVQSVKYSSNNQANFSTHPKDIMSSYKEFVIRQGLNEDPHQLETVKLLQDLQQKLIHLPEPALLEHHQAHRRHLWGHASSKPGWLDQIASMFSTPSDHQLLKGLYLWGDVGTGKVLISLFYADFLVILYLLSHISYCRQC